VNESVPTPTRNETSAVRFGGSTPMLTKSSEFAESGDAMHRPNWVGLNSAENWKL
jgi:hypothetical protein